MITLSTERLRLTIPVPGERPNTTTRFDRAGFISELMLDGRMSFCATEPQKLRNPCSGGRGLCSEWRFDASSEAKVGEYYPKMGIGLIKKDSDEPYSIFETYKDVLPYEVNYEYTDNTATFVTEPLPCLGYAYRTTRKIAVEGNTLTMIVKIENVGEKDITSGEYCHNFISIDGMAIGPDYLLEFPMLPDQGTERLISWEQGIGGIRGNGHGLTFCEYSPLESHCFAKLEGMSTEVPFKWSMINKAANAYIDVEEYFTPSEVLIWAVDHVVSPEIVRTFTVKPGESQEWKRVWHFNAE